MEPAVIIAIAIVVAFTIIRSGLIILYGGH